MILYFIASRREHLWKKLDPVKDDQTEDYKAYHRLAQTKLAKSTSDWSLAWCVNVAVSWYRYARDVAFAKDKHRPFTHIKPRLVSHEVRIPTNGEKTGRVSSSTRKPSSTVSSVFVKNNKNQRKKGTASS